MRVAVLPPPSQEALKGTPILDLLRDFPELFPALVEMGIRCGEEAEKTLAEVLPPGSDAFEILRAELEWRGEVGG